METTKDNFMGSGWAFPVTFSAGNHQVSISQKEKNINECIDIILKTQNGERLMHPSLGSGMNGFFFRTLSEKLKTEIADTVKKTMLDNEPRITVEKVEVIFSDPQNGKLDVHITYIYNRFNTRHNFVFPFHVIEGTNL